MSVNPVQFLKALAPRLDTEFGMVAVKRLLQFTNACSPIEVTPSPIVMVLRTLQSPKAYFPIDVIEVGKNDGGQICLIISIGAIIAIYTKCILS